MRTILYGGMLVQAVTMHYSDGSKSTRIYYKGELIDVVWNVPIIPIVKPSDIYRSVRD